MFGDFSGIIGNTPLIEITYEYRGEISNIYSKLEMFNYTGSIKDRIAYYMIENAILNNELRSGMDIVEATSGNTGLALSAIGKKMGYDVVIYMPDWVSEERVKLMESYGADVRLVSRLEGGFKECIKRASLYARENHAFFVNQFNNSNNIIAHYETTAQEIDEKINGKVDAFVSGIGSGGTIMGIGKYFKEKNERFKVIALEPLQLPILSGGESLNSHQIEGIGDDFIPEIVQKKMIDEIILIDDNDAILMAKKISSELGIGVGISSGANFLASVLSKKIVNGNIVTIFADDNKKYLSTNLMKEINIKDSIVQNIKLIDFKVM